MPLVQVNRPTSTLSGKCSNMKWAEIPRDVSVFRKEMFSEIIINSHNSIYYMHSQ